MIKHKKGLCLKDCVADPANLKQFKRDAEKLRKMIGDRGYVAYRGGIQIIVKGTYEEVSRALNAFGNPSLKTDIFQVSVGLT